VYSMAEHILCYDGPAEHWGLLPATRLASREILIEQNIKKRTGPALCVLCGLLLCQRRNVQSVQHMCGWRSCFSHGEEGRSRVNAHGWATWCPPNHTRRRCVQGTCDRRYRTFVSLSASLGMAQVRTLFNHVLVIKSIHIE
jgi:hypothetical protein